MSNKPQIYVLSNFYYFNKGNIEIYKFLCDTLILALSAIFLIHALLILYHLISSIKISRMICEKRSSTICCCSCYRRTHSSATISVLIYLRTCQTYCNIFFHYRDFFSIILWAKRGPKDEKVQARETSGTARVAQDVQPVFPYAHFQYFFSEKFPGCQGASPTTFFSP